ncbi:hypothetical protein GH714_013937 [Hevea brasiliensis]|uniref:Reticulon-like protein n=1 Tax=Hevea brasiliensis TaxID=3981 RepID=A0A6A6L2Z9_HEVBR|nr:hypothetical protein GH714_013937 [Hevea brasiliensis]
MGLLVILISDGSDLLEDDVLASASLPDLEISEETIVKAADVLQLYANHALSIAREIAIGRNLKMFLQVAFGLWVASYIGVLLSLSVPVLYDKYQHRIDEKLSVTHRIIQTQYRKIDESLLKKIPLPSSKEKKIQ